MVKASGSWHIWVDTGGTFTDCLALSPEGCLHRAKVLSSGRLRVQGEAPEEDGSFRITSPVPLPDGFLDGVRLLIPASGEPLGTIQSYDTATGRCRLSPPFTPTSQPGSLLELDFQVEAPILAARLVTRTGPGHSLPPCQFHLATTKSTNALLERKGDRTAFLVTRGFKDLLLIGDQKRSDLFARCIRKHPPLHDEVIEIDERLGCEGEVLLPLDEVKVASYARRLKEQGIRTVAIAFLHAYCNPLHEQRAAAILREHGMECISTSSDLAPFAKILPRAETAVVNAYLTPLMQRYLNRVEGALSEGRFRVMTSAGGFVSRSDYAAKDSLFSGPAGGLVGAATVAKQCGTSRTIAFDMGGTSTDVARFDGSYDYQFEQRISGVRLLAPSLRIETVAAGGGSICQYKDGAFSVGPESAGASPGPAAYGAGGPLTITDVNLLLGRMDPGLFGIPSDVSRAREAAQEMWEQVEPDRRKRLTFESMLQGLLDMANERMADAIHGISVREGYDPGHYALTAFGGAGGQHACKIAEMLGIQRLLFPAEAGLLSAFGLQHARMERFAEKQVLQSWETFAPGFESEIHHLEQEALQALSREGFDTDQMIVGRRMIQVRILGQETSESLDWEPDQDLVNLFKLRYRQVYGYFPDGKPIEIVSLRVMATTRTPSIASEFFESRRRPKTERNLRSYVQGDWCSMPVFQRSDLQAGDHLVGPALVQDVFSTLCIDAGWEALIGSMGTVRVDRVVTTESAEVSESTSGNDAMRLELFTHRFFNLVEEMGFMLERTAISTNVKERLDFSCALLDPDGNLIANAPHIPVHLGAIGLCVRTVMQACAMEPGDMIVTNHPGFGGSHLPDVTVICPVYDDADTLIGFVANRAHHAELGGIRPGSMPPDARHLGEEGVVIAPMHLYRGGEPCFEALKHCLTTGPYPSRHPEDNLADLQAQAAANLNGATALQGLARRYGTSTVTEQMQSLKQRSGQLLLQRLSAFQSGTYHAEESLDDGTRLQVRVVLSTEGIQFDFTGTTHLHAGNLNATPAIVHSVILYVLRLLLTDQIPLNEGLLENVKVTLPECLLNPAFVREPAKCPPVVGGNVETSQRLVDLLLKALGVSACSQGTMNNVIFGNQRCSYYETVCGGAGANEEGTGADAVHTHMTNTAITDPEILELRYPVRLWRFEIRRGSGGRGMHAGGDGIVRELEFLEAVSLSMLTQHRREGPYGLDGGDAGAPGRQYLLQSDGKTLDLPAICGMEVSQGDRLVLETPGGGGYGIAQPSVEATETA